MESLTALLSTSSARLHKSEPASGESDNRVDASGDIDLIATVKDQYGRIPRSEHFDVWIANDISTSWGSIDDNTKRTDDNGEVVFTYDADDGTKHHERETLGRASVTTPETDPRLPLNEYINGWCWWCCVCDSGHDRVASDRLGKSLCPTVAVVPG
jgi:hypothetical protein